MSSERTTWITEAAALVRLGLGACRPDRERLRHLRRTRRVTFTTVSRNHRLYSAESIDALLEANRVEAIP
jgi:hypothetical protein